MHQYSQPNILVEVRPGEFYSQASSETAFSITKSGKFTVLAQFSSQDLIGSPFVAAANDRFYDGSGGFPGSAKVFSLGLSTGTEQVYSAQAIVPILKQNLPDGTILGTGYGSNNSTYLVTSDSRGNLTPIYQFPGNTSQDLQNDPENALLAADGNYYGVVIARQANAWVYQVTPGGVGTTLYTLPAPGATVPFIQGTDGNFYGALGNAGPKLAGVIYKLTPGGQYTQLYSFTKGANTHPSSLIQASDGNLYGTTDTTGGATALFQVTTSGQYSLLHTFAAGECTCFLIQASDGIIYGTALGGGAAGGGFIWAWDGALPIPAPQARQFTPSSGPAGTKVRIWGYNLFHGTVQFNGVAATTGVHNSGSNYLFATVPAGATSGPVTVTTPGGSSTTVGSFMIPSAKAQKAMKEKKR